MENFINRSKIQENFTILPNTVGEDLTLSWKAKGILIYLLGKPKDWRVRQSDIVKHGTDGEDAVASGIKELIMTGYIVKEKSRTEDGKFSGYNYYVYDTPLSPKREKPVLDNPGLLSTDITNNILLHNIGSDSLKESSPDILESLGDSQAPVQVKTYGNKDISLLKGVLLSKYPVALDGVADRRKLHTLLQVLKKSKDYQFLDEDWKKNFTEFFFDYTEGKDEEYLVRSIDKLREKVKTWRETKRINLSKKNNE